METEGFVDDAVEVGAVCYVVDVEVGFVRGDGVDFFAEFGLDGGVLAEFVGDPGEGRGGGVAVCAGC
jgi:hypothetical protein|tara:strand:- start:9259 stop:9459 length:201 start_codon:yes stop_codon:yes gene_type:complete